MIDYAEKIPTEKDYFECLLLLSWLEESVSNFFQNVLIMSENEDIKINRFKLILRAKNLLFSICDLTLLEESKRQREECRKARSAAKRVKNFFQKNSDELTALKKLEVNVSLLKEKEEIILYNDIFLLEKIFKNAGIQFDDKM